MRSAPPPASIVSSIDHSSAAPDDSYRRAASTFHPIASPCESSVRTDDSDVEALSQTDSSDRLSQLKQQRRRRPIGEAHLRSQNAALTTKRLQPSASRQSRTKPSRVFRVLVKCAVLTLFYVGLLLALNMYRRNEFTLRDPPHLPLFRSASSHSSSLHPSSPRLAGVAVVRDSSADHDQNLSSFSSPTAELSLPSSASTAAAASSASSSTSSQSDHESGSGSDGDPCDGIHNSPQPCVIATTTCTNTGGLINYLQYYYCDCSVKGLCLFSFLPWLLLIFFMLGTTAEDYFCPTLAQISELLSLPPDIAGITILALGNGAPDVFSTFAAVTHGQFQIAIGELLGAGMFVTSCVVGAVALSADCTVKKLSFVRDVCFYLFAVTLVCGVVATGVVHVWEAIIFLFCYVIYVCVAVALHIIQVRQQKMRLQRENEALEADANETPVLDYVVDPRDASDFRQTFLAKIGIYLGDEPDQAAAVHPSHGSYSSIDGDPIEVLTVHSDNHVELIDETDDEGDLLLGSVHHSTNHMSHGSHGSHGSHLYQFAGAAGSVQADTLRPQRQVTAETPFVLPRDMRSLKFDWTVFLAWMNELTSWSERSIVQKIYFVVTLPAIFCFNLTIPLLEEDTWNKFFAVCVPLFAPMFVLLATGAGYDDYIGIVPVWSFVELFGVAAAGVVFVFAPRSHPPVKVLYWLFLTTAFAMSVVWIYLLANEVVSLLLSIGLILNISEAILGLTVLAWGNSVGDMVADVIVAKQGFPSMALAACFGGPFFNLLLGLGFGFAVATITKGHSYVVSLSPTIGVAFMFLGIGLISTLLAVPYCKWVLRKSYAVYLILLYVLFSVLSVLVELQVIDLTGI